MYRARRRSDGAWVAVKTLTRALDSFEVEVRALAALDHPHIVEIVDFGRTSSGTPFLVMPWADEGTLAAGTVHDVRTTLSQLLEALAHAHGRGVLHLDLKPSNVLLHDGGTPVLADFGLAELHGLERDERPRGTPAYLAPERFRGVTCGAATDLYAVGCLAVYLLSGRPPFPVTTWPELAQAHLLEPPPLDQVPPEWRPWIGWLLEKAPNARPPSAYEAREALSSLEATAPSPLRSSTAASETLEDAETWLSATLPESEPLRPRPFPNDWRAGSDRHSVAFGRTTSTTAALVRLRRLPTQGRIEERDRLWKLLGEAHGPTVITIAGAARVGTSHLASWLVATAVEIAGARRIDLEATATGGLCVTHVDRPPEALARRIALHPVSGSAGTHVVVVSTETGHPSATVLEPAGTTVSLQAMPLASFRRFLSFFVRDATGVLEPLFQRTGGSPGHTIDLLARGLEDGTLRATPEGLEVHALPELPPLHTELPDPPGLELLQVLAAWDEPVPRQTWLDACETPHAERRIPELRPWIEGDDPVGLRDPRLRAALRPGRELLSRLSRQVDAEPLQQGRWRIRAGATREGAELLVAAMEADPRQMQGRLATVYREVIDALGHEPGDEVVRRAHVRWATLLTQAAQERELAEVRKLLEPHPLEVSFLDLHQTRDLGDAVRKTADLVASGSAYLRAASLARTGLVAFWSGAVDRAGGYLEQATASSLEQGWLARAASYQSDLGAILGRHQQWEGCRIALEKAVALSRRAGDVDQESLACSNLADLLVQRGEPDEARVMLDQALELAVRAGTPKVFAIRLTQLELDLRAGRPDRAAFTRLRQHAARLRNATHFHLRLRLLEALAAIQSADSRWAFDRLQEVLAAMPEQPDAITRDLLHEAATALGDPSVLERASAW